MIPQLTEPASPATVASPGRTRSCASTAHLLTVSPHVADAVPPTMRGRSRPPGGGRGLAGAVRRREQSAVLELAEGGAGSRVLDAGCGDGEVAGLLVGRGARVVAVDLTLAMANAARRRGAWAVRADMRALPLRPAFDEVTCIGSSEFVADLSGLTAGLAGCLRGSGALVLLFPRVSHKCAFT